MTRTNLKLSAHLTLFFFVFSLFQPALLAAQEQVTPTPGKIGFLSKIQGFLKKGVTAVMGDKGKVGNIEGTTPDGQLVLDFDGEKAAFTPEQQKSLLTGKPGILGKVKAIGGKLLPRVDTTVGINADGSQPANMWQRAVNNVKQTFNQPKWVADPNSPNGYTRIERSPTEFRDTVAKVKEITIDGGGKLLKTVTSGAKKVVNTVTGDIKADAAAKSPDTAAVDVAKSGAGVAIDNATEIAGQTTEAAAKQGGKTLGKIGEFAQKTIGGGLKTVGTNARVYASAGVENVKTNLKAGFSTQGILMSAGITAALTLGQQIMSGGRPDLKAVAKTLVSGQFIGSFAGGVLGGAAGSFFVPALSAIPIVGGVLGALAPAFGAVAGSMFGSNILGQKMSFGQAIRNIDWLQVAGQGAGSVLGSSLGAVLGPFGMIVGGIIGGMIGSKLAGLAKKLLGRSGKLKPDEVKMLTLASSDSSDYNGSAGEVSAAYQDLDVSDREEYSATAERLAGEAVQVEEGAKDAHQVLLQLKGKYADLMVQGKKRDAEAILKAIKTAETELRSRIR